MECNAQEKGLSMLDKHIVDSKHVENSCCKPILYHNAFGWWTAAAVNV